MSISQKDLSNAFFNLGRLEELVHSFYYRGQRQGERAESDQKAFEEAITCLNAILEKISEEINNVE
jgi:hypothetical protein